MSNNFLLALCACILVFFFLEQTLNLWVSLFQFSKIHSKEVCVKAFTLSERDVS